MASDLREHTLLCEQIRANEQEQKAVTRRLDVLKLIQVHGKGHYDQANAEANALLDLLIRQQVYALEGTLATLQRLHDKQWHALSHYYALASSGEEGQADGR